MVQQSRLAMALRFTPATARPFAAPMVHIMPATPAVVHTNNGAVVHTNANWDNSYQCIVSYLAGIWPQVSWLFFKARAKRRYLDHHGRASNTEKQPTGRGPKGCVENGPAPALLVGYVSIQICALLAPCRRPILNPTICQLHMRRCTSTRTGTGTGTGNTAIGSWGAVGTSLWSSIREDILRRTWDARISAV
jgi:hypothetical protein